MLYQMLELFNFHSLARAVAQKVDAVVIDYDVLKSAALDAGITWDMAGRVGYEGSRAIAKSLLEQGQNVILDSPCRFRQIVDEGTKITTQTGAVYAYIECIMIDESVLRQRMEKRQRHRSQRVAFDKPPPDAPHDAMKNNTGSIEIPISQYPDSHWLQIDTRQVLDVCVTLAVEYLKHLRD